MIEFLPGDILSYSSGSTQGGADGYRLARRLNAPPSNEGRDLYALVAGLFPDAIDDRERSLDGAPPLFINAYPAYLGEMWSGVLVDTYLSERTAWRALQLAEREDMCAVVMGQPLFVAQILLGAQASDLRWPSRMMLWVGGYVLPASLRRVLADRARAQGCALEVIEFYGAAEVDAGCLIGRERDASGQVIYRPRGPDVRVELRGDRIRLQRRDAQGDWSPPFDTGDQAEAHGDGTFRLRSDAKRLDPRVHALLESWDEVDWLRRTGYVARSDDAYVSQLRSHVSVDESGEQEFYDFCREHHMGWLTKPQWGLNVAAASG